MGFALVLVGRDVFGVVGLCGVFKCLFKFVWVDLYLSCGFDVFGFIASI